MDWEWIGVYGGCWYEWSRDDDNPIRCRADCRAVSGA
jgi:3-mercaptopyruvate sulfurtransferase SseA